MPSVFEPVIGLEIHAQIATRSKLFCWCSADTWNATPNQNVCPICMGFPGQLPVFNQEALRKAMIAALALNCTIPSFSKFDRKNYFYPDLVKGFQISQYDQPLSVNGWVDVEMNNAKKTIRIHRLHVEDDAGKLTHIPGGTLCDYNRCGIGLMEIVTEPDIRNSQEAEIFAREIQNILRFVESSEADMEKGMMRFDASVSLRPKADEKLYPRAEIKNLNSFHSLEAAIDFEIHRQQKLWESGTPPSTNTTIGWDEEREQTYFMREKEGADDYRYFPEPDLPPTTVDEKIFQQLSDDLPELPAKKRERYKNEYGLTNEDTGLLVSNKYLARYFEHTLLTAREIPKKVAAFIISVVLHYVHEDAHPIEEFPISPQKLAELLNFVADGTISNHLAKTEVFEIMYQSGKTATEIIEESGLRQISDTSEIETVARKILQQNRKVVAEYKAGKEKVFGFLVGQVMKEMKGKANPQLANDILKKMVNSNIS